MTKDFDLTMVRIQFEINKQLKVNIQPLQSSEWITRLG